MDKKFISEELSLTPYTAKEKKGKKVARQIQVAEASLEMVRKKLCRQLPLLQPAIRSFKLVAVKEEIALESDGMHVFYHPGEVETFYRLKSLKHLEIQYLHFVLHGLLGHFQLHQKLGEDSLWDDVMDYEVSRILGCLTEEEIKEDEKKNFGKSFGIRGLYWHAKKHPKIRGRLKKHKQWDQHSLWDENSCSWEEIQEMVGMGTELEQSGLRQMVSEREKKGIGSEKGEESQVYEEAEETGNSYREQILQFVRARETLREQEGTIDKMLYSYGFELYGDIAFIEPEECKEQKEMKKVVIAIDTSGSCEGESMNEFLRETRNLLQDISKIAFFEEVILLQCDTFIQGEEHYRSPEEFPKETTWEMKGFGGTSFIPVFQRVEELVDREIEEIDFLVYFSDGLGEFPPEAPGYPVFFILPGEEASLPEWVTPIYYKKK